MTELRTKIGRNMWAGAVFLVGAFPSWAWACPTCKDGLSDDHVAAYAFSILFMMAMPYVLLGGFAAYLVYTFWSRTSGQPGSTEELTRLARDKAKQGVPTQPPAWDT